MMSITAIAATGNFHGSPKWDVTIVSENNDHTHCVRSYAKKFRKTIANPAENCFLLTFMI